MSFVETGNGVSPESSILDTTTRSWQVNLDHLLYLLVGIGAVLAA
jgi:hypothetical protein